MTEFDRMFTRRERTGKLLEEQHSKDEGELLEELHKNKLQREQARDTGKGRASLQGRESRKIRTDTVSWRPSRLGQPSWRGV